MKLGKEVMEGGEKSRARRQILILSLPLMSQAIF